MRAQLESVIEELKTLRAEGVEGIYLEDSTLQRLRGLALVTENTEENLVVAANARAETQPAVEAHEPQPNLLADWKSETSKEPAPVKKASSKPASAPAKGTQSLPPGVAPIPAPTPFTLPQGDKQTRWDWLKDKVLNDPVCQEHAQLDRGNRVVLGVGNLDADIFFCGEAPGADEALQGEPFVGKAGQLLNKIIAAMGLKREKVYIGNIMNWRPEHDKPYGDRPPTSDEMAYCLPHLEAQVEIVQPKVIVALGATAAQGLMRVNERPPVGRSRGQWFSFGETPFLITYHPSYLLRNTLESEKRKVWEDMLMVMEKVGMPISDKQRGYFLPKG